MREIAIVALLALILTIVLPIWVTRRGPPDQAWPDERFNARDRFRQTLAAVLGGLGVLATFIWSFEKDRQLLAEGRQQEATREFASNAALLGSDSVSVRAAGTFGLAKVAITDHTYETSVRDTLAAFIASEGKDAATKIDASFSKPQINADVQSAVYALGYRPQCTEPSTRPLFLNLAYLRGAIARRSFGFKDSLMMGVELQGADFSCADLSNSVFSGAQSGDYQAYNNWSDSVAHDHEWGEWHKFRFIAKFDGANLEGAIFIGAILTGASFRNADIKGAMFNGANLSRADFLGARNLTKENFGIGTKTPACADVAPRLPIYANFKLQSCHRGVPQSPSITESFHDGYTDAYAHQVCTPEPEIPCPRS